WRLLLIGQAVAGSAVVPPPWKNGPRRCGIAKSGQRKQRRAVRGELSSVVRRSDWGSPKVPFVAQCAATPTFPMICAELTIRSWQSTPSFEPPSNWLKNEDY